MALAKAQTYKLVDDMTSLLVRDMHFVGVPHGLLSHQSLYPSSGPLPHINFRRTRPPFGGAIV